MGVALAAHQTGFDLLDYPLFWPGVAVTAVLAVASSGWMARAIGGPRIFIFGLVFSLGLIASATLTPGRGALLHSVPGTGSCDLSRTQPTALDHLFSFDEASLNVILFVPLGLTIGFAAAPRQMLALLGASIGLPFAIEATQLVAIPLGRACQSADVVDNVAGLLLGYAPALVASMAVKRFRD